MAQPFRTSGHEQSSPRTQAGGQAFGSVFAPVASGNPRRRTRRALRRTDLGGTMGIGVSVFLLALGAILAFAVNAEVSGLEISTIGIILMIAGAIGLLMTMLVFGRRDRGVVAEDRVVTRERDVY
jgi:hypothetical protein